MAKKMNNGICVFENEGTSIAKYLRFRERVAAAKAAAARAQYGRKVACFKFPAEHAAYRVFLRTT